MPSPPNPNDVVMIEKNMITVAFHQLCSVEATDAMSVRKIIIWYKGYIKASISTPKVTPL
jgi:hypothetical protein